MKNLPNGGKPPATDDDEGLLMFRGSKPDKESGSEVGSLLPGPLAWDKFCQNMFQKYDLTVKRGANKNRNKSPGNGTRWQTSTHSWEKHAVVLYVYGHVSPPRKHQCTKRTNISHLTEI